MYFFCFEKISVWYKYASVSVRYSILTFTRFSVIFIILSYLSRIEFFDERNDQEGPKSARVWDFRSLGRSCLHHRAFLDRCLRAKIKLVTGTLILEGAGQLLISVSEIFLKKSLLTLTNGQKIFLPKLKKILLKIRLSIRVRNFAVPNEHLNIKKLK